MSSYADYLPNFFFWWTTVDEKNDESLTQNTPIMMHAAARNMPNGMLDPSQFSPADSKTKCLFQRKCIPICVTKKDLDNVKLRKTTTNPPRTKFTTTHPVYSELLFRRYKKQTQQTLVKELHKYFEKHETKRQ
jgi:hypothetical protein